MKLSSQSFFDGGAIPGRCAFGVIDAVTHVKLSQNLSPELSWEEAPAGTRSFALTCIDSDVPTKPDDVNQEGRTVPADLPRTDFVHWLMANIPASEQRLLEGACSEGVTARGKTAPPGPAGSIQGVNDYGNWFAGDPDMSGTYLGYDGPCPPWNDSIVHHYRFELFALDVERLPLDSGFTLAELRTAMEGHILDSVSMVGIYTLNPALHGG